MLWGLDPWCGGGVIKADWRYLFASRRHNSGADKKKKEKKECGNSKYGVPRMASLQSTIPSNQLRYENRHNNCKKKKLWQRVFGQPIATIIIILTQKYNILEYIVDIRAYNNDYIAVIEEGIAEHDFSRILARVGTYVHLQWLLGSCLMWYSHIYIFIYRYHYCYTVI